jgi:hypothetical protein
MRRRSNAIDSDDLTDFIEVIYILFYYLYQQPIF